MNRTAGQPPLVLCYHAVSPTWESDEAIHPAALERQVRHLLERGMEPRTVSDLGEHGGEGAFAITFDDAFDSLRTRALPLLERLGVPATVYAPASYVESGELMRWGKLERWAATDQESELRPLSWDGVRELARAGWEVGSHTSSHPRLTEIAPEDADRELRSSRSAIEEALGRPCTSIAYPFGDYDERLAGQARAAGYVTGVTLLDGLRRRLPWPNDLEIPRQGIYRGTGHMQFRLMTSPLVLRLRGLRP